jgi:hypothetical protein
MRCTVLVPGQEHAGKQHLKNDGKKREVHGHENRVTGIRPGFCSRETIV